MCYGGQFEKIKFLKGQYAKFDEISINMKKVFNWV